MKKIFTSLFMMLFAVMTYADVVYSYAVTEIIAKNTETAATGGKILFGADKFETSEIAASGVAYKMDGSANAEGTNSKYVQCDLNSAIAAGDVIKIKGFATSSQKAGQSYNIANDRANTIVYYTTDYTKTLKNEESELSITVAEGDAIIGATTLIINRTANSLYFTGIEITREGSSAAAGWDGTVTTSMDNGVITKLSDLDGLKLTLPGATSLAILDEEECQYMALQNENGSELYGIWGPTMGSSYTIDGNTITLDGFMTIEGATVAIPAGTTKLYVEDYGTLAIDGEGDYLPTLEFVANIAAAAEPFTLTSVSNNGVEGNVVTAVEAAESGLSYSFAVTADGKELSAGTATPTLSLSGKNIGQANIIAYGGPEAYIQFITEEQTRLFTEPGTYVLSIPEGTFVDAEGTPNAAATLQWAVIQNDEPTVINIENIEVNTITDDSYGFNDVYYTATVKLQKPAGAVYAYTEGLNLELNGELSNVPFQAGQWGMVTLAEGDEVTIVYQDPMIATTDDPDYEGDIRAAGSYVGTTEIYFMDENQIELPVTAKFTGSVVLPALATAEIGEPVFNVDDDPFYGMISATELEANGLKLLFPEATGITPDMQINVKADLLTLAPAAGDEIDGGFGMPTPVAIVEDATFVGDAAFGAPEVVFTSFMEKIAELGAGAYAVVVKSIDVLAGPTIVASWAAPEDNPQLLSTLFEVTADAETVEVEGVLEALKGESTVVVTLTANAPADAVAIEADDLFVTNMDDVFEYFEATSAEIVNGVATVRYEIPVASAEGAKSIRKAAALAQSLYDAETKISFYDGGYAKIAEGNYSAQLDLDLSKLPTSVNGVRVNGEADAIYNIAGQRVNNAKGIVILNGKKHVVK